MTRTRSARILAGLLMAVAAVVPLARGQSPQEKFYHAYYLETAGNKLDEAAKLYAEVVAARDVDAAIKTQAQARSAGCREELATTDFTRLMPPETLVYAELNRPGERLAKLIEKLGLMAKPDQPPPAAGEKRLAISPALIHELLGVRGAAVALTGFDPGKQAPMGLAIFHPGNVDVVRGLIETALPAAAESIEPIGGFPTFEVEGEAIVTLTRRLVIVSQQRELIADAVRRLKENGEDSLAGNAALASVLKDRGDDLLFFCVNAKPMMPLVNAMMAAGGTQSRELMIARALLDPNSVESLSGRAGIGDEGLYFELTLRLDKGHHNLVYNFLRLPPIDRQTLNSIPAGAAGFLALALSDAATQYTAAPNVGADGKPIVTFLDVQREVFANIIGVTAFVLPPEGAASAAEKHPIPDVAAVISVHDPAKSEVLWNEILGVASLASGGAVVVEGTPVEIGGLKARSFQFPHNVTVYLAFRDNQLLVSPSKLALERTLAVKRDGKSITDDAAFSKSLARLTPDTTLALFVHPGRCAQIARRYMSPGDIAQMEPVVSTLTETVAALAVTHSNELLRLSARVTGIPDVGALVARQLTEQQRQQQASRRLSRTLMQGSPDEARAAAEAVLAQPAGDLAALEQSCRALITRVHDREKAAKVAEAFLARARDDAMSLNNFAWALLTERGLAGKLDDMALKMAERANELTQHENWMFLDTLALARFKAGDAGAAVELERKAIKVCTDQGRVGELKQALARFEGKAEKPAPVSD